MGISAALLLIAGCGAGDDHVAGVDSGATFSSAAGDAGATMSDAALCVFDVPTDMATTPALAINENRYAYRVGESANRSELTVGATFASATAIPIPRYIGPFVTQGEGRSLGDYVSIGTLSKNATISFRLFNAHDLKFKVQIQNDRTMGTWTTLQTYDPNDSTVPHADAIAAADAQGTWATASVVVPTEQLVLAPTKAFTATNHFQLVVTDAANLGSTCDDTVAFGSADVDFYAQAPIVLVHGIDDYPENCWPEFVPAIEALGFIGDTDVNFAGLADKPGIDGTHPSYNGSVTDDVGRIVERMNALYTDYGTHDVNLVGHSKGGLDLVNFLATKYPAMKADGTLRVLTLQTLATPHAGSVNADIMQPLNLWAESHEYYSSADLATWGLHIDSDTDANVMDLATLTGLQETVINHGGPIDPGLSDLKTTSDAVAADLAWAGDPSIKFATYGWDADFNHTPWLDVAGLVTTPPAPSDTFPKYTTDCRGNPVGSQNWSYYCIDEDEVDTFFWGTAFYPPYGTTCSGWNVCGEPLWRQMAYGLHASVTNADVTGGSTSTIHVDAYGSNVWMGNDLTVALAAASHPHADQNFQFVGDTPRTISGLTHFKATGGTEAYTATCTHTGANHIAILRTSIANMVDCTTADVSNWIRTNAKLAE